MVCPSIAFVGVHTCPMVRRMPLSLHMDGEQATTPPALGLIKILAQKEWWESLEWDDPVTKTILQPYRENYADHSEYFDDDYSEDSGDDYSEDFDDDYSKDPDDDLIDLNKTTLQPYVDFPAPDDEEDVSNPSSSGGGILSDEEDVSNLHSSGGDGGGGGGSSKKRLRTRFSQEQGDKMVEFAERVGWRIRKEDEAAVERFCGEIGVTRQVLKVWMHNNKHTLGYRTPDEQNFPAPGPKSRGEEDSERLQLQVHQYSDATFSMSDRQITGGTAPEGNVLFMEKLVQLNEIGEVVTKRQKLSPEDKGSWKRETDEVSDSSEEELICLEELEETPSDPQGVEEMHCDPMEVPPIISHHFSILHELDLSYTQINSLPQSISRLVALQKLFLRGCELLMELPPEIGELANLEVLDLEGTEILCLPKEIAKLVNLKCLKVSFYGYANQRVIPRRVLSNLSRLKELIIDVTPCGEWWDVEAETIIDDMCSLKELTTLKLSLPTAELLEDLTLIFPGLENFRFTVGRHTEHFISHLPQDVEEEFNNWEKLKKGLKYINGSRVPNEVTKVFRHANAFFLQRHWAANSLSEFGHENMNEVKFCLVMECNEFRTVIDYEQFHQRKDGMSESKDSQDFDEAIVLGSLEKLIIRYMKNMESVWKGPVGKGSLSNLKSLALHACPNLTTLFTIDMFRNLLNLEELIVEDCPKIDSLVSLKSSDLESGIFLPNLKNISLLELPELVSISSGLCIAPNLERMVIFYCPKLEMLSTMDVSSTKLKVIKGEKEWWDTLKWYESDLSTEHEDYLAGLFIPLRRDGDLMAQLTKD